jgi:hypothetical protein
MNKPQLTRHGPPIASFFLVDRLTAGCFLRCCFPLKLVRILLQSILIGRLGKAGR